MFCIRVKLCRLEDIKKWDVFIHHKLPLCDHIKFDTVTTRQHKVLQITDDVHWISRKLLIVCNFNFLNAHECTHLCMGCWFYPKIMWLHEIWTVMGSSFWVMFPENQRREVWISHCGTDEDSNLLGCYAVDRSLAVRKIIDHNTFFFRAYRLSTATCLIQILKGNDS